MINEGVFVEWDRNYRLFPIFKRFITKFPFKCYNTQYDVIWIVCFTITLSINKCLNLIHYWLCILYCENAISNDLLVMSFDRNRKNPIDDYRHLLCTNIHISKPNKCFLNTFLNVYQNYWSHDYEVDIWVLGESGILWLKSCTFEWH